MISFASPAREIDALSEPIDAAVRRVLGSGAFILGEEVERFEAALARYTGARFAIGVSCGTDAIVCALHGLGIGPGASVVVPAFGFVAAPEAVLRVGARPVFVDIDADTLGPCPRALAEFTPQTVGVADNFQNELRAACGLGGEPKRRPSAHALIVMHLFGQLVDPEPLRRELPGVPIVEDAAQAMGATLRGQHAGARGEVATLSFFPAKTLGAAGDAGAVLTSDGALAARVRQARVHGAASPCDWRTLGGNYRLDALQAAVLTVKLQALGARLERRRAIGTRLAAIASQAGAAPLCGPAECTPVFSSLTIRTPRRDHAVARLRDLGVDARVQYRAALPASPLFAPLVAAGAVFPEAERASRELLSIPCHPELTDSEVEQLEAALRKALAP